MITDKEVAEVNEIIKLGIDLYKSIEGDEEHKMKVVNFAFAYSILEVAPNVTLISKAGFSMIRVMESAIEAIREQQKL